MLPSASTDSLFLADVDKPRPLPEPYARRPRRAAFSEGGSGAMDAAAEDGPAWLQLTIPFMSASESRSSSWSTFPLIAFERRLSGLLKIHAREAYPRRASLIDQASSDTCGAISRQRPASFTLPYNL